MSDSQAGLTDAIVSYGLNTRYDDIPVAALEAGKRLILDTFGVTLAASQRSVGTIITDYVRTFAGAPATASVLGQNLRVPPQHAALANGTMANALDYDAGLHYVTYALPAALASAEHVNASGRDFLSAFVVGHEIAVALTRLIDGGRRSGRGPTNRGWWHVGLVGPIASAVIASRLMGHDAKHTAMALGIAATSSGGFRRNMGTMAKALHSGNGASDGIRAAMLAKLGFTGEEAIIEAPLGFMRTLTLDDDLQTEAITEDLGKVYSLQREKNIKSYPACTPAHAMIAAALEARADPRFAIDQVEEVIADLHPFSLLRDAPKDEYAAGFNGPYLLAAALINGEFTLDQLHDDMIEDQAIRAMMERAVHAPSAKPGLEEVRIRLRDGTELYGRFEGRPRRLSSDPEIIEKFCDCSAAALAPDQQSRVVEMTFEAESLPDLGLLTEALRGGHRA